MAREHPPADYSWQTSTLGALQRRLPLTSSTQRAAAPDAIILHSGYPDRELLPERQVRAAITRAARSEAAVTRSHAHGEPALQAWFAGEVAQHTPPGVQPPRARDVLILPGSQSGLSSIFRAVVGTGEPMLIESPTYWGQSSLPPRPACSWYRLPSVPTVRTRRRSRRRYNARVPSFLCTAHVRQSHRRAVVRRTAPHGAGADAYLQRLPDRGRLGHDLAIDADPSPLAAQDDAGHVIYLRSLTKSVSPALRVAALIARGPAYGRITADRGTETMYVSGLLQNAALDVVTQPSWRTHLRQMRQQLRHRRDQLAAVVHKHIPDAHLEQVPLGGLSLWLRLPDGTDPNELVRACEVRGVVIASGDEWFPAEPSGATYDSTTAVPIRSASPRRRRSSRRLLRDQDVGTW